MFEEMGERFSNSIQEDFGDILRSSRMEGIPQEVGDFVLELLDNLFGINPNGTIKPTPKNIGDNDNSRPSKSGGIIIHVIPFTNQTPYDSDTLVVYCKGGDVLNNRLEQMLLAVAKRGYKKVFFLTSKWDVAAVTGNNIHRLQSLIELRQKGSNFCFILGSTSGISEIPVI